MPTPKKTPPKKQPAKKGAATPKAKPITAKPVRKGEPTPGKAKQPAPKAQVAAKPPIQESADIIATRAENQKRKAQTSTCERVDIEQVCEWLEAGESLKAICTDKLHVTEQSLNRWLDSDPSRSARVRESRKRGAHSVAEEGEREIRMASNAFELAKAKELAQHLRWKAAKLNPAELGDRIDIGKPPDAAGFSDAELQKQLAALGIVGVSMAPQAPKVGAE